MSTNSDDTENVTEASYTGGAADGQMDLPAAHVRLEGDGPQSVATDAAVDVTVDDTGRLELTLTADFENAERLLDRDLFAAVLVGKDL